MAFKGELLLKKKQKTKNSNIHRISNTDQKVKFHIGSIIN